MLTDQHIKSSVRDKSRDQTDRRGLLYLVLIGCVLGGGALHIWSYTFLNDDAYISFRYAAHWADHGEISYNLGERVEGYTNFLWVALLAGARKLGAEIPQMSLWLGGLLSLLTVALAGRLSAKHTVDDRLKSPHEILTMMLLILSPSFVCWSSGGLEVSLFTFLLTAGVATSVYAWREGHFKIGLMAGVIYGLTAMTRPEGVLLFAIAGLYRILSLGARRQRWRVADWGGICGFLIVYLPYFIWRYDYYGYIFPNTYYAKTGADGFWAPGFRYVFSWWSVQPWVALIFVSWLTLRPSQTSPKPSQEAQSLMTPVIMGQDLWWVTLLSSLGLVTHVAHVGGDFMAMHRFLVPLLPLCAVSVTPVLSSLYRITSSKITSHISLRSELITIAFLVIGLASLGSNAWSQHQNANRIGSKQGVDSIGWLRQFSIQCAQVGRFISEHTDEQVKLATTAAGALPYYAQRHTIDLLGLNDAWIAHHVPARGHRPGHTKSAPFRYPLDQKVDYLVYHPTFAKNRPRAHRRYANALAPWRYEWRTYQVPDLTPSWWGVWVLKTTPKINLESSDR